MLFNSSRNSFAKQIKKEQGKTPTDLMSDSILANMILFLAEHMNQ
jgi:hypothetical protein